MSVGQEINANHLRGVRGGHVTGAPRRSTGSHQPGLGNPHHGDDGKLCCISRITMAVIDARARADAAALDLHQGMKSERVKS